MPTLTLPDYSGGALVNVIAEVEHRLTGRSASAPLHEHLAADVNTGAGYVLVLFDGLGHHQLMHPSAAPLADSEAAAIDSGFPATTTVSLATVATGAVPRQHGLIGYQLWLPDPGVVINTIRWTTLWGDPIPAIDAAGFLPGPNLWERLEAAGVEAVTVQPANFVASSLSRALYRGCRFEGAWTTADLVDATIALAAPGRLVFAYVPHVDFAAHVHGQESDEYAEAVGIAATVWQRLSIRLPADISLVGVADHGHIDFPPKSQVRIAKADHEGREFFGDGRAMLVKGEGASLAETLPATWIPISAAESWWGPGPAHPAFDARKPDGILLADDDVLLLHRFSDDRMVGNHGALADAERVIPLLGRG
jgi:hypothetical protein